MILEKKISRLGIILLPAFNAMATASFIDPLRAANYLGNAYIYRWQYISLTGGPISASNGMCIDTMPLKKTEAATFDAVLVSASWTPEAYQDRKLFTALRKWDRRGVMLGGLDTGAFILGFAGLLNGYRATVHYEHIDALVELFPDIHVTEDLYIFDRNRMTCCGGAAASDLALELIRAAYGIDLANGAARYIFHHRLRSGSEGQNPPRHQPVGYAVPPRLRDAIVKMERNLELPLRIPQIALATGSSQRQLTRLFHHYTGVSAARYYLNIRLDRARGLITQTEMPVLEIAVACGFSSAQNFSRAYKNRFHLSPQKDRISGRVPFEYRSFPMPSGQQDD